MSEIPKAYEPQAVEAKWYQFWLDQKCFVANPQSPKPAYSIVIPPPNVTGVLTLGHVLNNTIQDILARKARMDGKEVLWLPGTDHAGIATQTVVEKALRKQGVIKHRDDLGREKFLEHVWAWKEKHGGIILQQLRALGASCDWTRTRFTMDPDYSRCVQKVFVELYKKGLIYRGKRMVNWDPAARTALSDEEVEMTETKGHLWHLKYPLLDDAGQPVPEQCVIVATTRPETMLGDEAVAVNPHDERYTKLVGRKVLLPLQNKPIPIIADDFVDPQFGTGCVKVTPAHDPNDFQMAGRHQLPLTVVIGPDGCMTKEAGEDFNGLDRMESREAVVEELTGQGLLLKVEDYVHNVGYSQRSHVPIEPYLSEQWFLKYPVVEASTRCVELGVVADKMVEVVRLPATASGAADRAELRESAIKLARREGWIGKSFRNEDTGWDILVRRKSLSHAFNNRSTVVIQAVAVLPELIRTSLLWRSESHKPPHPRFKRVHHFIGALEAAGELYYVPITVKELADGRMLYDYKARMAAPGGKPLVAHPPKETLGIQPAPIAAKVKVADLLTGVNPPLTGTLRFHPDRWAKTYSHWMTNIKDWCISRQLWWGHRIPVWRQFLTDAVMQKLRPEVAAALKGGPLPYLKPEFEATFAAHPNLNAGIEVSLSGKNGQTTVFRYGTSTGGAMNRRNMADEVFAATTSEWEARELEKLGFTQDPDVLDTWFSSWLWPFATMGWPEQTDTLKKFYPTTDLVTGPDIIFFWVARMIMAGYEFMGDLPFRNVYFTGIIRDKQGRKMSKSLGNSPDPLDLIGKYGADALRFGTMRSAPLGQDILFDEQNVELGRNFCNKLWNACRFRQMQGGEVQGEINPTLLTSDDKWILLRLNQAIREIDAAFADYKFSDAAATLYRIFWSELCDWYLEVTKAPLQSGTPEQKANTLAVLDFVLSHLLRLFHPFLPFITEELWHGLGYSADMPENQGGRTIMFAPWPKPLDDDELSFYALDATAEAVANSKYQLVTQGRNLRREFNLPPGKKIRFILKPAGSVVAHDVEVLRFLLNAEAVEINAAYTAPKGTPSALSALGELFLPLAGLIDVEAEKARLNKELGKIAAEIEKAQQRLNNPNFVQKVPPAVLAEHQARLAEWLAKQKHAVAALAALAQS
jgi:valyl-tRNA synthetase